MLNTKSFLAVDFGAGSLKVAEFEVNEAGGLRLKNYTLRPLGPEGAQESTREAAILKALQGVLGEKSIRSKNVNVCAPGFHVFSKFVKLPPVEPGKVNQIIQYEAQQNVPFPLAEVVWDYQILGSAAGGELEVLLVAVKAEIVEGLFRVTDSAGLKLQLCDASAAALCNAFRYNYGDIDDCSMLLDIGAKTSNLLFFEKGKVFARSINLGANSITQDFANESKLKFDAAEQKKIEDGFVSLGGAYEEPDNPEQAAISKIARQFMTRLHIQVNQTIQFYRGQQGGSAPQRLFLCGGASVMPYTAQFFAEKLNVPVEYFNPLRNVQLDPALDLEELSRVAHTMGEVVGLGLRNLAHCPVELNLMPESTIKKQAFNQKKPYFIATVLSVVAAIAAIGFLFNQLAGIKQEQKEKVSTELQPLQARASQFKKAYGELQSTQQQLEQVAEWIGDRYRWVDILGEIRQGLIRVEEERRNALRTDCGVWVEKMTTMTPRFAEAAPVSSDAGVTEEPAGGRNLAAEAAFRRRYGLGGATPAPDAADPAADPSAAVPTVTAGAAKKSKRPVNTNELATFTINFRATSLTSVTPEANKDTVYAVLNELRNLPSIDPDPEETKSVDGTIGAEEPPGTFTFGLNVRLKQPIKLR